MLRYHNHHIFIVRPLTFSLPFEVSHLRTRSCPKLIHSNGPIFHLKKWRPRDTQSSTANYSYVVEELEFSAHFIN